MLLVSERNTNTVLKNEILIYHLKITVTIHVSVNQNYTLLNAMFTYRNMSQVSDEENVTVHK